MVATLTFIYHGEDSPRFVCALILAVACCPSSKAGLEYAKEAVKAHRLRRDLEHAVHEQILIHLLIDIFLWLRELECEVEAILFKTKVARLNPDVVKSVDPPAVSAGADYHKGQLGNMMEYVII
jgi:hypothetical protein